jgi:hypothetical protein
MWLSWSHKRGGKMKVTLRDVVILVSTVALVLAIGWGLGLRRAITAHNQLVEELVELVQRQSQGAQPMQTPVPPEVPEEP